MVNQRAIPNRLVFAATFRQRLFQYVEYSLEADARRLGTMIFGDGKFLDEVEAFLPKFSGAKPWMRGVRSFASQANPVNYLMKVDWLEENVSAVSLYCRFIENLGVAALVETLKSSAPLGWEGPSLQKIAETLGSHWPHGIGFRITDEGHYHSAVYNRVSMPSMDFRLRALPAIVDICDFPNSVEQEIRQDIGCICRPGPVGIIAVDADKEGRAAALKLDLDSVPLGWALRFLRERGAAAMRIMEIENFARSLGIRVAGYLGLKYNNSGFKGWKLYLPIQPRLQQAALRPHLDVNKWIVQN